jgi:UV excision repair protein RAD23
MKITVKTTQQKVFQVDVEPVDTVAALKQKIQESQGHSTTLQKIIYSGKILPDDKTIESCGIKEKDFLVLMVSKPKPTPSVPSVAPASQPAAVSASVPEAAPASSVSTDSPASNSSAGTPTIASSSPPSAPAAPTAAQFGDSNSFLSGAALQTTINGIVDMGFPRDQVLRAMRASFNNADRAVEYLMNGIPGHLEAEETPASAAAPRQASSAVPPALGQPSAPAAPQSGQPQNLFQLAQQQQQQQQSGVGRTEFAPGTSSGLNFSALRNSPQIQQLRQQIAENPAVVQPLVQQIAAENPALAQIILQNPEALISFLGGNDDFDDEGGSVPPGAHVINVTEEERAAIGRLEALGFSREDVVEAYFACDKNEELAANYLFERGYDD